MKIWRAFVTNELHLYAAGRGLEFAFILSLALITIFRFGMPVDGLTDAPLEVLPVVAYCIANLQLLLMATHWESEAHAYRYYTMNRVSLSALFFAKSTVTFLIQIPIWIFCVGAYFLFFPVATPKTAALVDLALTSIPLGLALAPAGQLVAAIAQHSAQKNFLAIALFLPICLPVLIAATGRVGAVLAEVATLRYDALLVAVALIFYGAGNLLYSYLFEE